MSDAHVLYRFYSATGQLLYVGITMNPAGRFKQHRDSKDWWADVAGISIENYDSREALANAERRAIQVEHPLHNVVRTKPKPQPVMAAPDLAPVAATTSAAGLFAALFDNTTRDAEHARRVAEDQARWAAVNDCPFCDQAGYRGTWLCNHVDNGGPTHREALRQARKDRLTVIDGGPISNG